jgi:hypothetical protein
MAEKTNEEFREEAGDPCLHLRTEVVEETDDGHVMIECQDCGWQGQRP